ncbi:Mitochondrial outer membrane protein porin 4-like protein [Drosera capensis]
MMADLSFIALDAFGSFDLPIMTVYCRADKGEAVKASYYHTIDPSTAVAAEMIHRFSNYENSFTIGSSHVVDPLTSLKTRLSHNGKVAVLCQREWRPKSLVTASAELDTKETKTASKFGLAIALKP